MGKPSLERNRCNGTYETYIEPRSPEVLANILICLVRQTNYSLDQLLRKLEKTFLQVGGRRERMTHARLAERARPQGPKTALRWHFPARNFFHPL